MEPWEYFPVKRLTQSTLASGKTPSPFASPAKRWLSLFDDNDPKVRWFVLEVLSYELQSIRLWLMQYKYSTHLSLLGIVRENSFFTNSRTTSLSHETRGWDGRNSGGVVSCRGFVNVIYSSSVGKLGMIHFLCGSSLGIASAWRCEQSNMTFSFSFVFGT
jgi:hypothetical protein